MTAYKSCEISVIEHTHTLGMDEVSKDVPSKLIVEVLSACFLSVCAYPDLQIQKHVHRFPHIPAKFSGFFFF